MFVYLLKNRYLLAELRFKAASGLKGRSACFMLEPRIEHLDNLLNPGNWRAFKTIGSSSLILR